MGSEISLLFPAQFPRELNPEATILDLQAGTRHRKNTINFIPIALDEKRPAGRHHLRRGLKNVFNESE
jgi:hypothetical protein